MRKIQSFKRLSAIVFRLLLGFSILGLVACDPKKNTEPKQQQQKPQSFPKNEHSIKNSQLIRGLYQKLIRHPSQLTQIEQGAILRDLFDGIVNYTPKGNIIPGIAEKWQTTDHKSWIFHLRKNAKWSNSEALTAQDIVQSWQKLALSASPQKQYLQYLNLNNAAGVIQQTLPAEQLGIYALDENTLKIQLDKPTPYLPQMLSHIALLPQHPSDPNLFSGAYRVYAQDEQGLKLEKNPHYWQYRTGGFEQVIYQKLPQDHSLENIDWIENPAQKTHSESSIIVNFPQLCSYFYVFNFRDAKLAQSAVRKALVSMIHPAQILAGQEDFIVNGINFLPENLQFEQERDYQPVALERLLQQAGITEKQPLSLRLTYDNTLPHSLIGERLIQAWSQSDLIRITADPVDYSTLLNKLAQGEFQIIRSGWCADYNDPSAFLDLLHSRHPDNQSGFADNKIDQWLEQSLSTKISETERTAVYRKIIQHIQQENVHLPLFQYKTAVHISSDLTGYDVKNPTGVFYSKDLLRQEPKKLTNPN